jgi:hypothetical protein
MYGHAFSMNAVARGVLAKICSAIMKFEAMRCREVEEK